jgi:cytochrome c peroxidase
MALTEDKKFRPIAKKYAEDQDVFFRDFSKYFSTLLELGVPEKNFAGKEKMFLKTIEEQQDEAKAGKN